MSLSDNEIIEALPFLAKYCKDEYNDIRVDDVLLGAFDLINRQKAEIERRKNNLFCKVEIDEEMMRNIVKEKVAEFELDIKSIKAEAIKEFAERLKGTFPQDDFLRSTKRISADIDNLVKEMVGDTK